MTGENGLLFLETVIMLVVGIVSIFLLFNIVKNSKSIFDTNKIKEKMQIYRYKYYMRLIKTSRIYKKDDFLRMLNDDPCELKRAIKIDYKLNKNQIYLSEENLLF